jgi:hypothetical protein
MTNNAVRLLRTVRRIGSTALTLCFIGLPIAGHAANNCPWINEATASGLLGSAAVGTFVDAAPPQPAICTFTQQGADATRTLRITVELSADPHARLTAMAQTCGTDEAPLRAIGNEALTCAADDRKGGLGERVIGRVRDQVFTITISNTLKNDPSLNRDVLKARINTAAEQVAGNLF